MRLKNKKRMDERDNFKKTKWSLMKYGKLLYYFCYFCALLKISITKSYFKKHESFIQMKSHTETGKK